MSSKVKKVERYTLLVPFVDRVRREMERAGIHTWSELELTRVETDAGIVGWGETIQNYTWGRVKDEDRVIGKTPFELMWDDSLGAGLQMALFDAAGKLAGVPLYRLLGQKCRDWCAVSFWDHDMSPEKYEVEARTAVELGYTCIKIKTRPWFDVRETIRRISDITPDHFRIDADWNAFLNNASNAIPVLRELEETFPKIKIFEDPINRDDASGNRYMRTQIRTAIAHHYGTIGPREGVEMGGVCDGWVVGGGVSRICDQGATAAAMNMPFFLQMVGGGPTTALSLHLSAVLKQAQWPTINCHELYEHNLLKERIEVAGGHARVPEAPGLGVEMDEDAIERYRVEKANHDLPRRMIKVTRASGLNVYFANTRQKWVFFGDGNLPVDDWGSSTEYMEDDGSEGFEELYRKASDGPVLTRE
ncbi:MAG: enolase [Gemmatimonadetes bacterium]|nr:enolase [Gemmatimonadota bacterium]|tara:strand:+ start:275 stop:1528 length:1254 start_codon:yes stop_codon:yes gene_type:complete